MLSETDRDAIILRVLPLVEKLADTILRNQPPNVREQRDDIVSAGNLSLVTLLTRLDDASRFNVSLAERQMMRDMWRAVKALHGEKRVWDTKKGRTWYKPMEVETVPLDGESSEGAQYGAREDMSRSSQRLSDHLSSDDYTLSPTEDEMLDRISRIKLYQKFIQEVKG